MKIQELFERDIHRSINGVVKADQLDENSVWQELDEFVVTKELTGHIEDLVSVLLSTMEDGANNLDTNGVWVSGFFGCGKSHFIKVLSYVLENQDHQHNGTTRRAVDFFEDKLSDALLYADLKKTVSHTTDTILFNIDSKADHRDGRDALLQVFLKVLNEKQGYSSDHPHIANIERELDERGTLEDFHKAFEEAADCSWLEERDSYDFYRDQMVEALEKVIGQSKESVEKLVDGAEENFSLNVENFAEWVKRYLDSKGPKHRLMFLVDEVGQFIGDDTHLMLNLQTITENLCSVCDGRAWVVVTSQEDLDAVLGDLKNTKQQDFSKIQGRFKTRLSLSSNNVDEVIKTRLLDKNADAESPLHAAYEGKHDILRNQLSFVNPGMTFKKYNDANDFSACYPFAAYQFALVQKVFESIRKAGATGLHLSQGERSTLDAFQSAAKQYSKDDIGTLVPFYSFYPSVEGFLDTAVKRTIDQANDNIALEEFDTTVLRVLFLIRYIDELPGSVDNLVTLCVDEMDADRLALRKNIEASLARLEGETLISRNGDLYFFLTNEERDIGREIKNQTIDSGAEERQLGKFLFEDILGDNRSHTFSKTKTNFSFNRICDEYAVGNKTDGILEVSFVTPLGDLYQDFTNDGACILHSTQQEDRLLIRLPDHDTLGRELRIHIQTESYARTKSTGSLPETTKRILRDRVEDNRERRKRLVSLLKEMFREAAYFASGKKLELGGGDPKAILSEGLDYLIENSFSKMGYLETLQSDPKPEIQTVLRANDIEQMSLIADSAEFNPRAIADLREYIKLSKQRSKELNLYDLIEDRYKKRPYGWPDLEVVLLVARLAVLKEIELVVENSPLALEEAYEHVTNSRKQRKVIIRKREVVGEETIKKAQSLARKLFSQQGAAHEDELFQFIRGRLESWNKSLLEFKAVASTGHYPGESVIANGLEVLRRFVGEGQSLKFLNRFVDADNRNDLLDLAEDFQDLNGFYTNQRTAWENLRTAFHELSQNKQQLDEHADAGPALGRMKEILEHKTPYGMVAQASAFIDTATTVNNALLVEARETAIGAIDKLIDGIQVELTKVGADDALQTKATSGLNSKRVQVGELASIAHITQAQQAAEVAFDKALTLIEESQVKVSVTPESDKGADAPPAPPRTKKRRVVEPKSLMAKTFIETPDEMEAFLGSLRKELEQALQNDERVQIK